MRKFQKRGKISRKKMMRKVASGEQRQVSLYMFSHMSVLMGKLCSMERFV
jgi:5,10-methylenetetrahydrofolate reductase